MAPKAEAEVTGASQIISPLGKMALVTPSKDSKARDGREDEPIQAGSSASTELVCQFLLLRIALDSELGHCVADVCLHFKVDGLSNRVLCSQYASVTASEWAGSFMSSCHQERFITSSGRPIKFRFHLILKLFTTVPGTVSVLMLQRLGCTYRSSPSV